ncbi:MAG: hypothetical protein E7085_05530 [Parabacteroides distasonis]|nr:hypothetical protein [Parabacteroides distasonis]
MKNVCFVIIFICFFFSCQKKKVDPISRFDKVVNIQGKKLNVDTYKLNSQGTLLLFEKEQCVIKHNVMRDSHVDKISYTQDSVSSLLKHGSAPNESFYTSLMQKKDDSHFLVFDISKKRIITKDLLGNTTEEQNIEEHYPSVLETNGGYVARNSGSRVINNRRFVSLNKKGEFVNTFGEFPKKDRYSVEMADPQSRMMAYQGKMVYNPILNRMAFISFFGVIFEVYQLEENPYMIKKYHDVFPNYTVNSTSDYSSAVYKKGNIHGYIDLYATEHYIYALYSGKQMKSISEQAFMDVMLSNAIFVYDWNGNCVCRLVADKPLLNICVSEDNQELIALGWEDDYYLYSFDMSDVKLSTL